MDFIAVYGTAAVAASTIIGRIEMVVVMPGMGFGSAAGVLVGQNLGARKPERAEKSGWIAVAIVDASIAVFALAMVIWANQVVSIFSNDPQVIHYGSAFLRIASVGWLIVGTSFVLSSCLNGAGDTIIPLIAGLVSMWGAQIPLAYFLPKVGNLGVYGVRWAAVTAVWIRAITYTVYYRGGGWKHRKV
jgi:Na+-driven multidrug efflux pump